MNSSIDRMAATIVSPMSWSLVRARMRDDAIVNAGDDNPIAQVHAIVKVPASIQSAADIAKRLGIRSAAGQALPAAANNAVAFLRRCRPPGRPLAAILVVESQCDRRTGRLP